MADRDVAVIQAFGKVLREARLAAGLTQEALASACGVHVTYVSQLERGLKSPSLVVIFALADALDVRADSLVAEVTRIAPTRR